MAAERPWAERLYADRALHAPDGAPLGAAATRGPARAAAAQSWTSTAERSHRPRGATAARWQAGGDRPRGTHAGHVRTLRRWLDRRIAWLDGNL